MPGRASARRRLIWTALPGVVITLCALLLLWQLPAGALSADAPVTGNATYFDALGSPYGGCGLPQSELDTQNFVALNVFNTPGDYTMYTRPIPDSMADKIGMWDNGHNCGRWVRVEIGDFCTGVNDGAANQDFCRNGSWTSDDYNGATLDMIVADSCGDPNGWCRDDPYHLDLAKGSLNAFVKDGAPVGDMYPNHWNNRHISWSFIPAPDYSGDIKIGFLRGSQAWWTAIAISHLANGLHGVEYYSGGSWQQAQMNSDMGQSYLISPITTGGTDYRIRAYDVEDQPINNGRVYEFSLPSACGSQCSAAYTAVTYTTQDPDGTASPTADASPTPTVDQTPTVSPTPTVDDTPTPTVTPTTGGTCSVDFEVSNSWPGGFTANVTVTNTGTSTWNDWSVSWTPPSGVSLVNAWSATVTAGGGTWTAKAPSWAPDLAPGASTTFGFQASGSSSGTPTGVTCA